MTDLQTWDAWNNLHQPFELGWWQQAVKNGHSANDADFKNVWDAVRSFVQPRGSIIDIGCGPRPPFAPCTVVEPLADEYKKFTPAAWWTNVVVHAVPAEVTIPFLNGDTIVCWNCIDHAIGWRDILKNMLAYGNQGATYAVATDFHAPFLGHPGFSRNEFLDEVEDLFKIVDQREPFGRDMAVRMEAR